MFCQRHILCPCSVKYMPLIKSTKRVITLNLFPALEKLVKVLDSSLDVGQQYIKTRYQVFQIVLCIIYLTLVWFTGEMNWKMEENDNLGSLCFVTSSQLSINRFHLVHLPVGRFLFSELKECSKNKVVLRLSPTLCFPQEIWCWILFISWGMLFISVIKD